MTSVSESYRLANRIRTKGTISTEYSHTVTKLKAISSGSQLPLQWLYCHDIIISMYSHHASHIGKSIDQPGKVANPARGQFNR